MSQGPESDTKNRWGVTVPALRDPRFSESVDRGIAILECFSPAHPVRGIADVAEELGMKRSTTHRYMSTLLALGYLEQGVKRKYRLGLRVTDLGMATLNATGLREHALPYMDELSGQSSYTVSLAVLDGPDIIYVARVQGRRRGQNKIDPGLQPGSRLPAYCSAMGKLLLAHLPREPQDRAIGEMMLKPRAPGTITSKRRLRDELASICEEGYAINDQELVAKLHAIAVPVRSETRGVVAALSMAAHVSTIPLGKLVNGLKPHLVTAADRISARLGYRRDDELSKGSGQHG
jgi:IclR family transcriptional regulator, pca regulon regulatory protein